MNYYQLYLITNLINNKKYVGQTIQTKGYKKRFKEHIYSALNHKTHISCLHKAISKYGPDNFEVKLLIHNIPEDKIDFYECLWIDKLNTYYRNYGYNMTFGGSGVKGYHFTEDVKTRMSCAAKQYWENLSSDEYERQCHLRSERFKGVPKSEEHKKHLSESRITSGVAKGKNNPFYGRHHSEHSKQLIGQKNSKPIGMFSIETGECIKKFNSTYEAVDYLLNNNITKNKDAASRISKICRGLGKTAYGYNWKFL